MGEDAGTPQSTLTSTLQADDVEYTTTAGKADRPKYTMSPPGCTENTEDTNGSDSRYLAPHKISEPMKAIKSAMKSFAQNKAWA